VIKIAGKSILFMKSTESNTILKKYRLLQKETKPAPIETKTGEVSVIEYSEKAIAVIGDTYPIKEKLKEAGGKFNKFLSCGAGWIFPKTKLTELQTLLNA
jgi:hypothetical protein